MGRSPLKEPNSLTFGRVKIMPTLLFYQALYTTKAPLPPLKKRERLVPSRAFQPDAIPQLINGPF